MVTRLQERGSYWENMEFIGHPESPGGWYGVAGDILKAACGAIAQTQRKQQDL